MRAPLISVGAGSSKMSRPLKRSRRCPACPRRRSPRSLAKKGLRNVWMRGTSHLARTAASGRACVHAALRAGARDLATPEPGRRRSRPAPRSRPCRPAASRWSMPWASPTPASSATSSRAHGQARRRRADHRWRGARCRGCAGRVCRLVRRLRRAPSVAGITSSDAANRSDAAASPSFPDHVVVADQDGVGADPQAFRSSSSSPKARSRSDGSLDRQRSERWRAIARPLPHDAETRRATPQPSNFRKPRRHGYPRCRPRPTRRAPKENFTGTAPEVPYHDAGAVAIELSARLVRAGRRTAWHPHPLGETLDVTSGIGRVQAKAA